jgi:hypothetical protein
MGFMPWAKKPIPRIRWHMTATAPTGEPRHQLRDSRNAKRPRRAGASSKLSVLSVSDCCTGNAGHVVAGNTQVV